MGHKLMCIYRSCPPDPMFSGQGKTLWCTQRALEGRLWGFTPPVESSICFSVVYTQKILTTLCSCIYEIQKFCSWKRKDLYSIFTFLLQFIGIAPGPNLGLLSSRRPGSTHFRQFLIYLLPQNNAMNLSSKRHQCHQNYCLNKPYFMLKMHNSVHTFHISLAITHTERKCYKALSHQQTIRSFRHSVSVYSNPHFVRLLIEFDALAWPDFSTNDGKHIAGMISRIALQHL